MNKFLIIVMMMGFTITSFAQKTVSGQVLERETNMPLIGVTILVKDSAKGTTTDFDGNYIINDISDTDVLVFSYLGYKTHELVVGGQSTINVSLETDAEEMDEVVVTALNIQRDKESLGYSVSQVSAEEVNVAKENNVMNSLSGKVSGLQITQANTGVDGSSRILLRGVTTINGSNRPLVVVDGIPISGDAGGGSQWGGVDRGDALSDINPDDVESISVLKGAGAAAAYGSLGMHGVILVTTKSGGKKKGIGVSLNSSFTFTEVALTPNLQNEYGAGAFGDFAPIGPDGRPVLDYPFSWSWGPKMEGQTYTNWLGESDTYASHGNPYEQFYQNGYSASNSVAFEGQSDKGSFRISITDENARGINADNTLAKQTFNIRGKSYLTDNFSIDGKMTYLTSKVKNRPALAEDGANTALQLSLMPRDIRLSDVKNNTVNAQGEEIKWNLDNTFNNPYWSQNNVKNIDEKDRFQGVISANWDIAHNFKVSGKTGMDYILYDYINYAARGSQFQSNGLGNYGHDSGKSRVWNSDVLATYNTNLSDVRMTLSLGSSYRNEYSSYVNISGNDAKVPNLHRISNYKNSYSSEGTSEKGVYSFYGLGQFSYRGFLYFDATIRNDNSSALPKENNSYWYHSENMSLLFSKLLGIESNTFNKGKLRGSYAVVGNDTSPYRTQAVYNVDQTVTLPYTVGSIPSSLPSFDLRPETSESWEVGAELGFFNNRLQLDFTYYETKTKDQIMAVPISGSTGYASTVINAGVIANKGYEFQLNAVPLEFDNFEWNLGFNFTKSNSKVESLNDGLESITLNSLNAVSVEARPGEEFGSIYGYDFLRDNFGRKLITNDGFAQKGERVKLGSITPDWYGGITNKFRYKNFSISTLITIQEGGEFYSYGRAYRMFFGTDARSLEGRETGIIVDGINENTGFVNETPAPAMLTHYSDIFTNEVATNQILDASNVKFKELVITYDFPSSLVKNSFIQSGSISAIGRNLFYFYNAAGDIDPEAGYSSGPTGTALEHSSLPSTRSYGLNLKINF
ncbi:SusC/RagA family TonB-linked outer membrane protein [Gelidibacter maritimus]|uniref:SusC/RagA family TonB-linked outer membrane protein n=1 Tax=Gelidibacter maritimus TaxID=2761487 RepID=A0A7W2M857_9FLAO|nr:SusC/RagA family TonB-linked outer membrane protein [Gelidibacter maritimus]MBA6154412.1 SusC/RagA family TonB-linked outer membrane protein [Gelidibacter maritimus]